MATDEADAALHHQRNGFSRVLNEAEENYFLSKEEKKKEVQHAKKKRHLTHTSVPACFTAHMSISVCTGCVQEPAVARRPQLCFCFWLFGFFRNLCDVNVVHIE